MADKKLNITADLKVRTSDAERVLQKLSKEGIKISKILKDLDINTSQGRAGFAKSLVQADKAMLKLRGTTHDTAKAMEHTYGRQLEKQGRNLDLYTKKIERLNKIFKSHQYNAEFQQAVGNTEGMARARAGMDKASDRIVIAEAARQATKAAIEELKGGAGSSSINWDRFRGAMGGAQAFTGGMSSMLGSLQGMKTMEVTNIARIRDLERGMLGRMMSGDMSDLYLMTRKTQGGKGIGGFARDKFMGTGLAQGQIAFNAAGQVANTFGSASQMVPGGGSGGGAAGAGGVMRTNDISNIGAGAGGIAGGVGGTISAVGQGFTGGSKVIEAQTLAQGLDALKEQDPMMMAALQWSAATAPMRVAAAKGLQGKHMSAWGIGQGFGLDMGESMSAASQLARQFGVGATMGRGSSTTSQRELLGFRNGVSSNDAAVMEKIAMAANGETSVANWRRNQGLDVATGQAYQRVSTTKTSPSLFESTLGLERMGIDRNVAGTALGTMMQGQGGDLTKANHQLEDILTKAFGRGIRDARIGEEIVKASGELAFGYGGAVKDIGAVGMMLSGGLTGSSTMRDVQQNVTGLQAVNQLLNGNQYFQGVKAEGAIAALGRGGTGSQMMAAQKSSISDLVGGSQMLDAAGITPEQRKKIVNSQMNSLMGAFLQNSNDPATSKLRAALTANGGDVVGALQGAKGGLNDQFALALSTNSSVGFEQALGFARDMQGFGSTADKKGRQNFARHGDGVAEAQVRAKEAVFDKLFIKEIELNKDNNLVKALGAAGETVDRMNQDPGFEAASKFFNEFIEIIRKAMLDPKFRNQFGGKAVP